MKKELQKQMDSMMEMTMEAITNNKKLEPALNDSNMHPKMKNINSSYFMKSPINIYMNY